MQPQPFRGSAAAQLLSLALVWMLLAVRPGLAAQDPNAALFVKRVDHLSKSYIAALVRNDPGAMNAVLPPAMAPAQRSKAWDSGLAVLRENPGIQTVLAFGAEIKGLVFNGVEPVFSFDSTALIDVKTGSVWVNSLTLGPPSDAVFVEKREPHLRDQPEVESLKAVYLPLLRQAVSARGIAWQDHSPPEEILKDLASATGIPHITQQLRGPWAEQSQRTRESAAPYLNSDITTLRFGFDDLIVLAFDDLDRCLGGVQIEIRASGGQVYPTEFRHFIPLSP